MLARQTTSERSSRARFTYGGVRTAAAGGRRHVIRRTTERSSTIDPREPTSAKGDDVAYDENLAQRVRDQLADEPSVAEKAMFGGLAFLLDGNMAVGISGAELMVRIGPDASDDALGRPHTRVFDMTAARCEGGSWSRRKASAATLSSRNGWSAARPSPARCRRRADLVRRVECSLFAL
jgi:hypothetical protein